MCGRCLTLAYTEVVLNGGGNAGVEYACPMCLERGRDRESMGRKDEPGWPSPLFGEAVICRRCIELAVRSLEKDKQTTWKKPEKTEA